MNAAEHRAEAERLLAEVGKQLVYHRYDRATAVATQAVAHATLAAIPDWPGTATTGAYIPDSITLPPPSPWVATECDEIYGEMSGADKLPQKIVYQGKAVGAWHEKNAEPFTSAHRAELHVALGSAHEPGIGTDCAGAAG